MIGEQKIRSLVDEALTSDQFVVELRVGIANQIYIEVDDRTKPISITDCIKVSRQVEHNLDREVEDFSLEVTSPGLDRPFRVLDQYIKNIGKDVKIKYTDGKSIKGKLIKASEEQVLIETKEKRRIEGRKAKEWITEQTPISMDEIKETFIELVF